MTKNTACYAIVSDTREGLKVALIDRKLHPNYRKFWTGDNPDLIFRIASKALADKLCSRFRHNNPQVVNYWDAVNMVSSQMPKESNNKPTIEEFFHEESKKNQHMG